MMGASAWLEEAREYRQKFSEDRVPLLMQYSAILNQRNVRKMLAVNHALALPDGVLYQAAKRRFEAASGVTVKKA